MCGIVGEIGLSPEQVDTRVIGRMCEQLAHRGPDSQSVVQIGRAVLGHRRLRVIDLETGDQPIYNEDGSVAVIFNGEIYNYAELRAELAAVGHRFATRTDTEVIGHLYEDLGPGCLERLSGMFALAIWDSRSDTLFLARDRVGKKPIFYTTTADGRFLFASEAKALLAHPAVTARVNVAALDGFLAYQYIPPPLTVYQGIYKLPPAHSLLLRDRIVQIKRYWELDYRSKLTVDEPTACDLVRTAVTEATRARLVSDVPLGAFLSGGVDSSIVVGLMSTMSNTRLQTFSIGFEDARFDESPAARLVARTFETEHHEHVLRPESLQALPRLAWHFDEPFADSSALPTYYLAGFARSQVTVAVSGDGGDESFAGYERYRAHQLLSVYDRFPDPLRRAGIAGLLRVWPGSATRGSWRRRLARLNEASQYSRAERYGSFLTVFPRSMRRALYRRDLKYLADGSTEAFHVQAYDDPLAQNEIDRMLQCDVRCYLPEDILVKVDRMSMAHGLEARSPLLDHRVMELAARLPATDKIHGRELKYILKSAFSDLIPASIRTRPKRGFGAPVGEWFRTALGPSIGDILLSTRSGSRMYFDAAAVEKLLQEHLDRRVDHSHRLWALVMFELWHSQYIRGEAVSDLPVASAGR